MDDNMAHAQYMVNTQVYRHSEYAIITVYLLQQWLHEHVSMLCYM